uniref:Immunoglobulin domain-containing protein n=1 Tax=Sinocyclocheilus anshuiensis TaxID=1608454 RepID=A0A671NI54_9TELE
WRLPPSTPPHEGESAEIICPYDSIYKSKSKSLCKGTCSTRDRNTLSETVREEKESKTRRLTLNDNVTARVFTGTITGLTAEDAGKYWCAVTLETDLNYLYTHLIVIMNEVNKSNICTLVIIHRSARFPRQDGHERWRGEGCLVSCLLKI